MGSRIIYHRLFVVVLLVNWFFEIQGQLLQAHDTLYPEQWYLSKAMPTVNVEQTWDLGVTGKGIVVGIMDEAISRNVIDLDLIASSSTARGSGSETHGDKSAGVAAAQANSMCGRGVAYEAQVRGYAVKYNGVWKNKSEVASWIKSDCTATLPTHVFSCSFGPVDTGARADPIDPDVEEAQNFAAKQGRSGRGSLFVWAAGNGGLNQDSCAYDGTLNARTSICVAGVYKNLQPLRDGEQCSAMHAVTFSQDTDFPANDIVTVSDTSCDRSFGGSSAACPMASGVLALVLSANPALNWRDVHHLIALTTSIAGVSQSQFITNAAGFKFSNTYGFGLLDACRMTEVARKWTNVPTDVSCVFSVPLNGLLALYGNFTLPPEPTCRVRYIEHVIADIDFCAGATRAKVHMMLTSPRGTPSILLPGRGMLDQSSSLTAKVKSLAFWGELLRPGDEWQLRISERNVPSFLNSTCNTQSLLRFNLLVYGTASDPLRGAGPRSYAPVQAGDPCFVTRIATTSDNSSLTAGEIAGIAVGCVVALTGLLFLVWFFIFKNSKSVGQPPTPKRLPR